MGLAWGESAFARSFPCNCEGAFVTCPRNARGRNPAERQRSYRDLFRDALPAELIDELRAATNGGWAIGNDRFKGKIAKALARRVTPLPRGPRPKNPADKRQLNLL